MNDQRKAERIATERPVNITHSETNIQGKMIDLSVMGCGILSQSEIKVGAPISLNFRLPSSGETDIQLDSVATHAQKVKQQYLIGVTFTDLSHHHSRAISDYISYHHRLDYALCLPKIALI